MIYHRKLNPEQIRVAQEQSHSLWGAGQTFEYRLQNLFKRHEYYGEKLSYMSGYSAPDGRLVCSLKRYYYPIVADKKVFKTIGLGAIFTDPSFRKEGHASLAIEKVLKEASEEEDCDLAVLYSDIDPRFYKKFGFVELPATSWSAGPTNLISRSEPFGLKEASPSEFGQMNQWYETGRAGAFVRRDAMLWRLYRDLNHFEKDWILTAGGKEVGYITYAIQEGQMTVGEFYVEKASVPQLVATLRRLAEENSVQTIKGWVEGKPIIPNTKIQSRTNAVPMIKYLKQIQTTVNYIPSLIDHF